MSNKFPGFCISCKAHVGAGHGKLTRAPSGAWVVQCGSGEVGERPRYRSGGGGRRTGCSCGSVEGRSKPTDCWTCRHDEE